VRLAGGAAEAAGIDDGAEVPKLMEFHGRVISSQSSVLGSLGSNLMNGPRSR
jgi:hypothetical protein